MLEYSSLEAFKLIYVCLYLHSVLFYLQSRVVSQNANERSFHIFYQLCAGATSEMKGMCHFTDIITLSLMFHVVLCLCVLVTV